jgi:hypothetical protein
VKIGDPNIRWKRLLPLESLAETFAKMRLNAQRLEYKDAHPDHTLLGRIVALIKRIVEYEYDKIMSTVSIDDE